MEKQVVSPILSLNVLGIPTAQWGEQALHFPTRKTLALLIYLAVTDTAHTRRHLAALLWPDADVAHAHATLRRTMTYLKQALIPLGSFPILADHDRVGLTRLQFVPHMAFQTDISLLEHANHFIAQHNTIRAPQMRNDILEQAACCYQSPFLDDFVLDDAPEFEAWSMQQRAYWQGQANEIFDALTRQRLDTAAFHAAANLARRWIRVMPFEEVAYQRLMEAQAALGERLAALGTYDECQKVLHKVMGMDPAPETRLLSERVRRSARPISQCAGTASPLSPFVGRQTEFAALVTAFHQARKGTTQVMVVEGKMGIGKSRLLNEFLLWAGAQGADALQSHAYEASARLSYQPIVDAFRLRLAREHAPDDLLADVWLAELVRLFPELYERYPDLPAPAALGAIADPAVQGRLFEAVVQLGLALAAKTQRTLSGEPCPLIIVIEHIQYVEIATRDLLQYALQRWSEEHTALLLILTASDDDPVTMTALPLWLIALSRQISLRRLVLSPLTKDEVLELLGIVMLRTSHQSESLAPDFEPMLVGCLADWLYDETSGHPFYLLQLIRALLESDLFATKSTSEGNSYWYLPGSSLDEALLHRLLPGSVRDLLHARLLRLSPVAANLLLAGSILGREFTFISLCRMVQVTEHEGLNALEELLQQGLLEEICDEERKGWIPDRPVPSVRYNFEHEILREAVYLNASESRRQVYQQRALTLQLIDF